MGRLLFFSLILSIPIFFLLIRDLIWSFRVKFMRKVFLKIMEYKQIIDVFAIKFHASTENRRKSITKS